MQRPLQAYPAELRGWSGKA